MANLMNEMGVCTILSVRLGYKARQKNNTRHGHAVLLDTRLSYKPCLDKIPENTRGLKMGGAYPVEEETLISIFKSFPGGYSH